MAVGDRQILTSFRYKQANTFNSAFQMMWHEILLESLRCAVQVRWWHAAWLSSCSSPSDLHLRLVRGGVRCSRSTAEGDERGSGVEVRPGANSRQLACLIPDSRVLFLTRPTPTPTEAMRWSGARQRLRVPRFGRASAHGIAACSAVCLLWPVGCRSVVSHTNGGNKAPAVENFAWLPVGAVSDKLACSSVLLVQAGLRVVFFFGRSTLPRKWGANTDKIARKDAECPHGHKARDADRWGTAALGLRPGNGVSALFLPCVRGSHRHTAVITRPRLSLAL